MTVAAFVLVVLVSDFVLPLESRHLLKRESSQNVSITEQGLNCMTTVLDCPKTPSDVVTLGDPSEGQQLFRQNFFTDLCRYVGEFVQCANDHNVDSDPDCEEIKPYFSHLSQCKTTLCGNPILPILEKIQGCLNSKHLEVTAFRLRFITLINSSQSEKIFCRSYRKLVEKTIVRLKTCSSTLFQWSKAKEMVLRKNFYPAISCTAFPFRCDES
uniref:Uncharacterized protein LOC111108568 isoform X1 n=2 Tax=Crassostrea virginica TaxID=6565 RepID=A0A8B8BB98_CRAVI|nr:uncharacterized protein LOC111108568 isoform X1 [Crassostrea virginica]